MIRHEDPIHIAIIDYLRATLPHGWVIQHTPNKPRSKIAGAQEKRMGALAGWPDIAVYGQLDRFVSFSGVEDFGIEGYTEGRAPFVLFLEVKAPKGRVSENQHLVHDKLKLIGFPVVVVRSVDDVREVMREWEIPSKDAALNDNSDPWQKLGDLANQIVSKARGNA